MFSETASRRRSTQALGGMKAPSRTMSISYLADHTEFIPTLVPWSLEQWRFVLPEEPATARMAKFHDHCNHDVLPIAWVAHASGRLFGTAALRLHDLEGREDLTPWLGGLLVAPQFRRRGIGAALCRVVEEKAYTLGTQTLYLFTLDKQAWYAASGWSMLEPYCWRGYSGDIMAKQLRAA